MKHYIYILLGFGAFLFSNSGAFAQNTELDGRFLESSTKVGAETHYILKMRHKPDLEVLFPDSTYDFSPFELLSKQVFPTKTDSVNSLDSVVYTLATYSLDARQGLRLPAFIADPNHPEGMRPLYPRADSIELEALLTELPDSLAAFENTQMAVVTEEFNYPILILSVGAIIVLAAAIWLIFGQRIREAIALKKLKKQHLAFIQEFSSLTSGNQRDSIEPAISLWKKHTGAMLQIPMGSYTTKEVGRKVANIPSEVIAALKQSDQAIYAGAEDSNMETHFNTLKEYSQEAYQKRVAKIKSKKSK